MNTRPPNSSQRTRIIGYACGLAAGAIWGTTGPLSTALYAEGAAISPVGFWRLLLAVLGFTIYGLFARDLFRIDRKGIWLTTRRAIGRCPVAVLRWSNLRPLDRYKHPLCIAACPDMRKAYFCVRTGSGRYTTPSHNHR